jgi:chemotaxis signal transduction protein
MHAALGAQQAKQTANSAAAARAERLLDIRTRTLASPPRTAPAATTRALLLAAGEGRYALPLPATREVIETAMLVPVPGAGTAIAGIINWRGEFAVVVDLRVVVGASAASKPERAVVLSGTSPRIALAVDAVHAVTAIDRTTLRPADTITSRPELFAGIADAILLLDEAALRARIRQELRGTESPRAISDRGRPT